MFIVTEYAALKEMKRFVIKWLHVKHDNKTYEPRHVISINVAF